MLPPPHHREPQDSQKPAKPPRPPRRGSLQRRLLVAALGTILVALLVTGIAIGLVLHRFVRGQIDSRLDTQIATLAADLRPGPDGRAALDRGFDGPPFDRPLSGWYWEVRQGGTSLRSRSLAGGDLDPPDPLPHARSEGHPAPADGVGPKGEPLILRVLALPETGGTAPVTILASAPKAALLGPVSEALTALAGTLALLGLCLTAGAVLQVRLGLRPLRRLRRDLADVRGGRIARVPETQPAEVRPLVDELNALLLQNEANLERARAHVANLAHALKTPLATLSMRLSDRALDPDGSMSGLVGGMDRRVRHHLRRARAAALAGPVRTRTELGPHVEGLRLTMARLHAERAVALEVDVPAGLAVACDGEDLDEMLGNLIDNACQWCRGRVRIAATAAGAVRVSVEDDGPGLGAAEMAEVGRRGRRLDESVPGHGLGLSITAELADLYGGSLALDRSPLGGLRATLTLPA